ncbi:peptidoglycan/LPS O-acetylase OafA/YrhL [Neorhizobium galegae]|uniref:acyltransferase family protein n=1 Tax=Neorhizobium galegae TaxID=399 RepID=UPI001AE31840|nr:acyltransferase [Neorhizobium galegae]MBP2557411.1 peptidoglycan/LPS O-acetylase OafA/YrhL [Neorhizobium galegae]
MDRRVGRFTVVDALRGVAATGVVVYHVVSAGHVKSLLEIFPVWVETVLSTGGLGVAVFFVLSGFVIAHSLYDKPMSFPEFGRFTLRRSLRLDPAYWGSIAVTIAFAALSSYLVAGKQMPNLTVPQIVSHLFYLQDLLGYPAISTVYWTLCLEIQFYLVYALLMSMSGFRTLLVVAACIISLFWPLGFGPDVWPGLFLPLWYGFLLGVMAYWAWRQPKLAPFFGAYAGVILLAGVLWGNAFGVVCSAAALGIFGAAVSGRIGSGLNWRWLQFLGLISYSLYLTHNLVIGAVFRVAAMAGARSPLEALIWWVVSLLGCVAFAAIFWLLIERPSMELSKRLGQRKAPDLPSQTVAPLIEQGRAGI